MNNQRYNSDNVVKDNSRRILYVTVIIAALFVAAISGTFAYFTASATNNTTINGTIASTSLSLAVTKLNYPNPATNGPNLIPMDTTAFGNLNTALNHGCVDSNGYTACQVYRIAVTSPANSPRIPITGTVNIAANSGSAMPNLTYTILAAQTTGASTTAMNTLTTTKTYYDAKVTLGNNLVFTAIDTTANAKNGYLEKTTTSPATYNYYLIVWLEDTGSAQNSIDYGTFTGTVSIESATGNITATFS